MMLDKNNNLLKLGDRLIIDPSALKYCRCKEKTGWIVKGFVETNFAMEVLARHTITDEVVLAPLLDVQKDI